MYENVPLAGSLHVKKTDKTKRVNCSILWSRDALPATQKTLVGEFGGKKNILNKSKRLMNKRLGKKIVYFYVTTFPIIITHTNQKKIIPIPWKNLRHQLLEKVIKKLVF